MVGVFGCGWKRGKGGVGVGVGVRRGGGWVGQLIVVV